MGRHSALVEEEASAPTSRRKRAVSTSSATLRTGLEDSVAASMAHWYDRLVVLLFCPGAPDSQLRRVAVFVTEGALLQVAISPATTDDWFNVCSRAVCRWKYRRRDFPATSRSGHTHCSPRVAWRSLPPSAFVVRSSSSMVRRRELLTPAHATDTQHTDNPNSHPTGTGVTRRSSWSGDDAASLFGKSLSVHRRAAAAARAGGPRSVSQWPEGGGGGGGGAAAAGPRQVREEAAPPRASPSREMPPTIPRAARVCVLGTRSPRPRFLSRAANSYGPGPLDVAEPSAKEAAPPSPGAWGPPPMRTTMRSPPRQEEADLRRRPYYLPRSRIRKGGLAAFGEAAPSGSNRNRVTNRLLAAECSRSRVPPEKPIRSALARAFEETAPSPRP